jgi:two-component system OmpR family sensor kinase
MSLLSVTVLGISGAALYVRTQQALTRDLDSALLSVARTQVASALDRADGKVHVHNPPVPPGVRATHYEEWTRIEDASGGLVVQTQNLEAGPSPEISALLRERAVAGDASYADLRRNGQAFRAIYHPLRDAQQRPLVAVVGISKAPMDAVLRSLLEALLGAMVVGAAVAAGGGFLLAGALIRPLEKIAATSHAIGEQDLSVRLPRQPDRELEDVASALNEMLGRLENAFEAERQMVTAQQRFAADASHELRSPLANLRVSAEVALLSPRTAEDYRETLATQLPEVERLSRLVEHLLTLSRADAGQLALADEPCDIGVIAAESVRACRDRAGLRQVRIELQAPEPLVVAGDRDRLREVLDNLLDNALRYAPDSSEVQVSAAKAGRFAVVVVRDHGPGIPVAEQAHIFDRFYRADLSRSRKAGGTGLGLPIAKAIVEGHRGEIQVTSEPPDGARFLVKLPLSRAGEG